ncbi:MAG: HNH endonuclease [Proteobacteria bacterium]|nr:HNH endonuclease [Pseudomonadota bacterium]
MHSSLKEPVLVLNANYEPLNVCTIRRAMGLIFAEKADMLVNGRGEIRTSRTTFPAPSVIRLGRMIKRPRPQVKLNKQEVFRRDNHTCQYCGAREAELTLDHVLPRSQGGLHTWENLVAACRHCNHRKGGRTAEKAGMRLNKRPVAPSASASYRFGRYLQANEEWGSYIQGW